MTHLYSWFFRICLSIAFFFSVTAKAGASVAEDILVTEYELASPPPFWAAGQLDPIASRGFQYQAQAPSEVLDRTIAKLKGVFQRYRPAIGSGTTVLKPLVVSGSDTQPRLQMSVRKCVLFVCETVDLDATVSIREGKGNCARNFVMTADLARSSVLLVNNYQSLRVNICAQIADASANLKIDAFAERGPRHDGGTVSREIFDLLSNQIPPMTTALSESLKANGAR